jgi:hypothetical protein
MYGGGKNPYFSAVPFMVVNIVAGTVYVGTKVTTLIELDSFPIYHDLIYSKASPLM